MGKTTNRKMKIKKGTILQIVHTFNLIKTLHLFSSQTNLKKVGYNTSNCSISVSLHSDPDGPF